MWSELAIALFLVLPVLLVVWHWVSTRQPKGAPPTFSYLANALSGKYAMKANGPCNLLMDGYRTFGECFSLKVAGKAITVMMGPEAQAAVFALRDDEGDQRAVYQFTIPVFGKNIAYDAEPKRMAEQLRFLKFGLAGEPMKRHGAKIVRETEDFFKSWGKEPRVVDLHETISELTINTASRALMGSEIRNNLNTRFATLYQQLSDGMTHLTVAFPYAPVPLHWARDKARCEIVKIFKQVITQKREAAAAGKALDPEEDMINFLLAKKYSTKAPVSDDDICGLLLATLFAGQHTSTITATWCGMEIAHNKTLKEELLAEQREVLKETNGEMTFDALQNMKLLNACVKETLRKYPPLIALLRKLQVPLKFKDYVIPAGNIVAVSPAVAHKLDDVFPNPEQFDPGRFLKDWDLAELKKRWIPFGGGIHKCLGQNFGLLQVTAVWSHILRNFELETVGAFSAVVDYSHLVAGPMPGSTKIKLTRKEPMRFDGSEPAPKKEEPAAVPAATKASKTSTKPPKGTTMTLAEVAKHNTADDCYIVVNKKVYDVTAFLSKHPGGEERIMKEAGTDATFAFDNQDHSAKARMWMKAFEVADLAD